MTLGEIEIPMPGVIKIMVAGVEHRVMRAAMTDDGLVIEAEPVGLPVEQDPESGRWYTLDSEGERMHGPYIEEDAARAAARETFNGGWKL